MIKKHTIKGRLQMMKDSKTLDPVCGRKMNKNKAYIIIHLNGEKYYLCCPKCQSDFEKSPEKYINNIK